MFVEPPRRRARWPGWDGGLLLGLSLGTALVYLARGRLGGGGHLLVLLGLNLVWLAVTAFSRRAPRPELPPFKPVVVIPTHNNAGTIAQIARACLAHLPNVIVLDDGSTDATAERARSVQGITLLQHPTNRGKGAALASALEHAHALGFSHAICIDADGQHEPDDIPAFVQAAREQPWVTHVGSRDMSTAPGSSRFGRRFSNFWIWAETGHHVADSQCGFRTYPIAPVLALGLGAGRYEWEIEVLVRGLWAGVGVRDLDCRVYYPPAEERVSSFRMFWDNVRISWLNTRLVFARLLWPTRWFNRERQGSDKEWRDRHRGTLLGWTFFLWMIRLVGRRPTYAGMAVLATFYLLFAPTQREGLLSTLRRLDRDSWGQAWRVFYRFACSLIDRFVLLLQGPQAFHFDYDPDEVARAHLANDDRGVIFITAHLGNAELGAVALQSDLNRRPVNILQYTGGADPYMTLLRQYGRGAPLPHIISLNAGDAIAAIEAVRALKRGEILALKGDRVVDPRVATVDFLGGRVQLPTGPWLLAAVSGAPVIALGCFKEHGDHYRIVTTPPRVYRFSSRAQRDQDLQRWTQEYATLLESWTRQYPLQFYNFHDLWVD